MLDGDGAFDSAGLLAIAKLLAEQQSRHVVGRRGVPQLSSPDDISSNTRIFIEAYFNTVILISLGPGALDQYRGFDIQCGLQGFKSSFLREVTSRPMPFYGGEAILFHRSVSSGIPVASTAITQHSRSRSAYRSQDIVDGLLNLEFIKRLPVQTFESAITVAPKVYSNWDLDGVEFRREIEQLVISVLRSGSS